MKKFKTLIVDDEELARDAVRGLLQDDPEIEIVGEARDGRPALEFIRQHRPDLVVLDIQMPIVTGIELLKRLEPAHRPTVIFVTAYDEFAVRAFELNAVDYVMKPFTDGRFATALRRAKQRAGAGSLRETEAAVNRVIELLQARDAQAREMPPAAAERPVAPFVVRQDGEVHLLNPSDIRWIEAEGDFINVHTKTQRFFTRMTLGRALAQLDPARFARVHKSIIVNTGCIRSVGATRPWGRPVELDDGTVLRISRTYRGELDGLLGTRLPPLARE
jgi:two-component system LytT family response regulator